MRITLCTGLITAAHAVVPPISVTLTWNPTPGANIAGYKLYYGLENHSYTTVVPVGNATRATVSPLISGATYFFAVTSYDTSGLESDYSSEIIYTVPGTVPTNSVPGLVAAYAFDEGSGLNVADASGNGNAGSIAGASWSSSGRFGKALSFDGLTSAVVINDSASLGLTTGMTLEAWVYPTAVNTWRDVIYKGDDLYYLEAATPVSGPCAGIGNSATNGVLPAPSSLAPNTWSHLAATYDGGTLRLFVNGVQVASKSWPGPIATSTLPLSIGADTLHGSHFAGLIDEVRIYNRALGASEIQTDLNTPITSGTGSAPAGPTVHLTVNASKQAILSGTGPANTVYNVECTTNLTTWSVIGKVTNNVNRTFQFTDPALATRRVCSYRLRGT